MSAQIGEEFRAAGVAQVIVILDTAKAGGAAAGVVSAKGDLQRMRRHFVTAETSQDTALAIEHAAASGAGQRRLVAMGRVGPAAARSSVVTPPEPMRVFPNLGIVFGTVSREGLAALRSEPSVEQVVGAPRIGLIRPKKIAAATPRRKLAWGLEALGTPKLWKQGLTGKNVIVAHLDTGADGKHAALKRAIAAFAAFDDFGFEISPAPAAFDSADHGTHTAATIAGRTVKNFTMGMAPGAKLASAVVIEGGNAPARVLAGMDWAVGQGARVINMSLGFRGYREDFLPLTKLLRDRGILPVFAVGNEGPGTSRSPGNYPESLSVGAVARDDIVADFSSSQRFKRRKEPIVPDLLGPGVDVISAKPGGGFQAMDGTSMATPHISGLAALLFEAKPDATPDQVEAAIFGSCLRGANVPAERGNRGMPEASRALAILTGSA